MNNYIYQKDLADGTNNLPKIGKSTQAIARKNGKLQFTKIGRHIVYKKSWIEDYLNRPIPSHPAKTTQEDE
jgi:hypothetical protein